jgi:hypothetical protein
MHERGLEISDGDRGELRSLLAAIQSDIACLSHEGTAESHRVALAALVTSWAGLVALLDIGPALELRPCPTCGESGRREATRCGYCWTPLSPATTRPIGFQ